MKAPHPLDGNASVSFGESPVGSLATFLAYFALTSLLWYSGACALYMFFGEPLVRTVAGRGGDKQLQYLLLALAGIVPWATLVATRRRPLPAAFGFTLVMLLALPWIGSWFSWEWAFVVATSAVLAQHYGQRKALATPPHPTQSILRVSAAFVLAGVLTLTFKNRQVWQGLDFVDDGPRLASINAYLAGRVPFRDFLLPYGILQELGRPLLAFRLWGVSYEAYRRLGPWLSGTSVFFLFLTLAQGSRRWVWPLSAAIVLLMRSDWFVPDRVLLETLTVFLLCRALQTGSKGWAVGAGGSAVASLLYSLDVGLVLGAGLTAYFALSHRAETRNNLLKAFLIGSSTAALAFLAWTLSQGACAAFWRDGWHQLLYRSGTWSEGLPSHLFAYAWLSHRQPLAAYAAIHQPPILALAAVAYYFWRPAAPPSPRASRAEQGLLLAVLVFFQFFIYIGRSDFIHWKTATVFVVLLAAFFLEEIFEWSMAPGERATRIATGALAAIFAIPFWNALAGRNSLVSPLLSGSAGLRLTESFQTQLDVRMPPRWGALRTDSRTLDEVASSVTEIQAIVPSGATFYDFANQGVFYFLTQRQNPTRFGMVDLLVDPAFQAEFFKEMTQHPPAAVLGEWQGGTLYCLEGLNPVRDFILAHYTLRTHLPFGNLVVLVPKASPVGRTHTQI